MNFLLAQSASNTSTTLEFDWPLTVADWCLWAVLIVAALNALWMIFRDTRQLPRWATVVLMALRLAVLTAFGVIALNPHLKTQSEVVRPSHVMLLVDTSKSMQQPVSDPREAGGANSVTRTEAVASLLADSPLIASLRTEHNVDVYTFDDDLSELRVRLPQTVPVEQIPGVQNSPDSPPSVVSPPDWKTLLEPQGLSTRLGDSLDSLLSENRSPTLAGVVVVTDGASNAGRDSKAAHDRAESQGVRLVTVGVGSERPPVNLELLKVIAPIEVQKGDAFDLTAYVQGIGVAGQSVKVELLQKEQGSDREEVVATKDVILEGDGVPAEVLFSQSPFDAGEYEFTFRVSLNATQESRAEDNQQTRTVTVFDRPLKVLFVAGGPMREYSFSRTSLHRHTAFELDVWLQSGKVGISQDAKELLFRFPETREDLYKYDVIVAFDPDWDSIPTEQMALLEPWIAEEGGGLIVVVGDVFTRRLTSTDERLQLIRRLLPVVLDESSLGLGQAEQFSTAFPVGLTQEGESAGFLALDENLSPAESWQEFGGVYRCYPTRGRKAGTVVYAEFSDPLSRGPDGQPPLIADQRFGQGHVVYIGSPEFWRLRSVNDAYYERFWTKLVRKAAEGRSKRGIQRGMFVLEGRDFDIGQTIPLRVRAVTAQFTPLAIDELPLEIVDPRGRPVLPPVVLTKDRNRPAEFTGDFHPVLPGQYQLSFEIPDSAEKITADLAVQLPQLEAASLTQNSRLLKSLSEGTGGQYVSLADAEKTIPGLLPNRSRRDIIDERVQEVWDRKWVMYLLAGLLSAEWLLRKLLKLA